MSEPFVFDPRHELCKQPYGAVVTGTKVTLHVRPLTREKFTGCTLMLLEEFSGQRKEYPLTLGVVEGDRTRFDLEFTAPTQPELIWYHFRLTKADGSVTILDRTGYHTDGYARDVWQMTVYDESHFPQWFGSGIAYQIFPDRFHRLSSPDPKGMIGNRWVHENWDEPMVWKPDSDGEVRNRDFFGGSLEGIRSKLDYLQSMGITTLYLCPIFESASNHRYNTADYRKIDPMLGTEEDFQALCDACHQRGMRVILDGVFNHIGSQSLYFNADGFYPTLGAAQSKDSPWYDWFRFKTWPTDYEAWWGIMTLPAVEETNPDYQKFIYGDEDSVVRHWLRCGADGWRLDVADELPDEFIAELRTAMEEEKPDSLLLGEVWEDGTTKIAYSKRRKYLLGHETHGLMNYPFRTAALNWLQGGSGEDFCQAMEAIRENYPPPAFYSAMNFLGTHDTARVLTILGAEKTPETKEARSTYRLSPAEYRRGAERLRVGAALLYTFPGCPTVYYGDECGAQGFEDPFCRQTYPWGKEDLQLQSWFFTLGRLRSRLKSLQNGKFRWLHTNRGALAYAREGEQESTVVILNAGDTTADIAFSWNGKPLLDALTGQLADSGSGTISVNMQPRSVMIFTT